MQSDRIETAPGWYKFKLGEFILTVLSDGPLPITPPHRGFIGVEEDDVRRLLSENFLATDRLPLDQNVLLVDTGRHKVLIDTGVGTSSVLKSRQYGPNAGRLIPNLRAAGVAPSEIDIVALTHPHHDHAWGLTADGGVRNFPNAQLAISEEDFDFWTDEAKFSGSVPNPAWVAGARHSLFPYRDRLIPVRDGKELVSGVVALAAPGHTMGHHLYAITSEGRTLLHMGDAVHHQVLLLRHPEWRVAWDTDPDLGVRTRLRMLDMIENDGMIAFGYHCAWPGLGRIVKASNGYSWLATPMFWELDQNLIPPTSNDTAASS